MRSERGKCLRGWAVPPPGSLSGLLQKRSAGEGEDWEKKAGKWDRAREKDKGRDKNEKAERRREGERGEKMEGRKEGGTDEEQDTEPSNICKEAAVLSDRGQQVWR